LVPLFYFHREFKLVLPVQDGIVAFAWEYTMNAVEVSYRLIDFLDKLAMPTVTKLIDRLTCLGFKCERISFADVDKPTMEGPPTIGIRIIVPLFIKRAGRLYVPCTGDAHQLFAGCCRIYSVLQHMRGIDIVEHLVLERERFHCGQKKRKPNSLYRLSSFRVVLGQEIDQMGRVIMRTMAGSNIQDPFLRGTSKSPAKMELVTTHHTTQSHMFDSITIEHAGPRPIMISLPITRESLAGRSFGRISNSATDSGGQPSAGMIADDPPSLLDAIH
jgi:hypothetical protein